MAINPLIALQGQMPDVVGNAQQGLEFGRQFAQNVRMSPIQEAAMQARAQAEQAQAQQALNANQIQAAQIMLSTAQTLKQAPMEQRQAIAAQAIPQLQKLGIDPAQLDISNLDDQTLDSAIAALQPFSVQTQQRKAPAQALGNGQLIRENGQTFQLATIFDPNTGTISQQKVPINAEILNRAGLTQQEAEQAAINRKAMESSIATSASVEAARRKAEIDQQMAADIEKEKGIGKSVAENMVTNVNDGVSAAALIPDLNKGIDLLNKVNTSGFSTHSKAIAQYVGAENADEAELQSIFSNLLLQQMQSMKGLGAMSEGDRKAIEQGIASFGKDSKSNQRILERTLSIAKRTAEKGLREARKDERFQEQATSIESALKAQPAKDAGQTDSQKRLEELRKKHLGG